MLTDGSVWNTAANIQHYNRRALGASLGQEWAVESWAKRGKLLLCNRMEGCVIYNAMYVIPLGSVGRCVGESSGM